MLYFQMPMKGLIPVCVFRVHAQKDETEGVFSGEKENHPMHIANKPSLTYPTHLRHAEHQMGIENRAPCLQTGEDAEVHIND